jgi:hypothetical protein
MADQGHFRSGNPAGAREETKATTTAPGDARKRLTFRANAFTARGRGSALATAYAYQFCQGF